jgi:hypothetical protein
MSDFQDCLHKISFMLPLACCPFDAERRRIRSITGNPSKSVSLFVGIARLLLANSSRRDQLSVIAKIPSCFHAVSANKI